MTALERLALIVAGLSDDTVVPVPVRWVRELLAGQDSGEPEAAALMADLTVADLATLFKRSPSTVRSWLEAGRFPGAFKLRGRDWRVPRAALDAFRRTEQEAAGHQDHHVADDAADVDLGAWRRVRGAAA